MTKLVVGVNDLQSKFPKIAEEWNYERNYPLTPDKVTYSSNKKVWWKCKLGHEWEATINSRTNMNSGCPICAGRQVLKGFNDLASLRPDLAKEWNYERNGDLKSDMVKPYSNKKVWWRCEKGHEWKSRIAHRVNGVGCPICAGRQVLKGFNDLASLRPDLAKEWNYERNGDLKPDMITCGSHKLVWWKCEYGHEWKAEIKSRASGNGCPICAGRQVLKGFNDLASLRPDLAKEWNYERNGDLKPDMVTYGTDRKVWWRCSKHPEHEWEAAISSRTRKDNAGCPICAGRQVLAGYNDLSSLRPDIAKEWNYEKNGDLTPEMVTCGSNKTVWWKCEFGHEWKAFIYSRALNGNGCPICAKERMVSFPEKIITYYLKKVLPIKENIFIDRWNVDILYNNVVIEYDGEYFHSQCVDKDELKNKDLNGLGFTVIRILGKAKSDYIKLSETRYEICELNYDHFKQLIPDLCTYLKVSCPDVDVERDREKIKELLD